MNQRPGRQDRTRHLESTTTLAAVPSAVSCCRVFVRLVLRHWGLASLVEAAELVTSELVTNAVKATGVTDPEADLSELRGVNLIRVQLTASLGRGSLFVSVWDASPYPPVLQDGSLDAEGGRGLWLVSALSARWSYYPSPRGGKVVWCEVAMPPRTEAGLPLRRGRQWPCPCPLRPADVMRDRATLLRVRDGLLALQSSIPASVPVSVPAFLVV